MALWYDYPNENRRIYLNGEMVAEAGATPYKGSSGNTHIGQWNNGEYFNGMIDDVQVYSRPLADAEVVKIMSGLADTSIAQTPSPEDGATDVPRDVVVSWDAGDTAATHDIYFGTSFDDVNDGVGTLVSPGQTAAQYDPEGLLEFGQTYYWRVDEVNAAPDNTVFNGETWSFTVEPFTYPIENIIATANGTSSDTTGPEDTINGSGLDADDRHSDSSADMWLALPGDEPVFIQYEFDRVYKLHEMMVWNHNTAFEIALGFGLKDVTIEYSLDGVNWTMLGDFQFAQGPSQSGYAANTIVDFADAAVKYVRITVISGWGSMATPQYGLSEVRFLYIPAQARQPVPADAATGVAVDTALTWRAGREAVSHELYLGTDPNAPALVDALDVATFAPDDLAYEMTYYWKVDEVNEADAVAVWEGDLWSFSTQAYGVIDDFESYNDDDNVIYETWLDGWVNGTGSFVGYFDAPFAEQTIVHGGGQSMPLSYENSGVDTSEAEFTVAAAQDWTAANIQALTLYFAGEATNDEAQLYVVIDGTRVDYDGAVSDLQKTTWQVWNIDLSTVGGNLSNVSKLTIGIEGSGATGILYIDDIRLYPRTPEYIIPVEPEAAGLVAHYTFDEGSGTTVGDASGNGNDGTINGDSVWTAGILDGALQFGGNDYVDCGNDASLVIQDTITVACWIKIAAFVNDWETIIGMGDDSYRISRSSTNGNAIHFGCNGPTGDNLNGNTVITDDTWHHVAVVFDGAYKLIYIDGVEDARAASTGQINVSSYNLYIGENSQQAGRYLHGLVDDARIYNRVLSPEELAGLAGRTGQIHKPF